MNMIAGLLLLIGGAVHAFPMLYEFLTSLTGGIPLIQIVAGAASILAGLALMKQPAPIVRHHS